MKVDVEQDTFKEIDRNQYEKMARSMYEILANKARKEKGIQRLNRSCMDEIHRQVKEILLKTLKDQRIRVGD